MLPLGVYLGVFLVHRLGDRSYEKRKGAALEVEALVKALAENNDQVSHDTGHRREALFLEAGDKTLEFRLSPLRSIDTSPLTFIWYLP